MADPRGLCPAGWHVPSDSEWTTLENFLGGGSVAGGKMKAVSPLWQSPNIGATNSSGFTGLPGGYRSLNGSGAIAYNATWWSSTQFSSAKTWSHALGFSDGNSSRYAHLKTLGFSVRCIRD